MKQFSLTSATLFVSLKLLIRDYLRAIAIFINGVKGASTLQVSRDMGIHYKTAFVLSHKLREAMDRENILGPQFKGEVEIDGTYFGGHVKPENKKEDREDRHLRRAEIGQNHRVGVHLAAYAGKTAWRENNRRKANGTLFQLVAASAAASSRPGNGKGIGRAVQPDKDRSTFSINQKHMMLWQFFKKLLHVENQLSTKRPSLS